MAELIVSIPAEHLVKLFSAIETIDTVFRDLFREWVSTRAKYADTVSDINCQLTVIREIMANYDFTMLDTNSKFARFSVFIKSLTTLLRELQGFRIRHRPNFTGDKILIDNRFSYALSDIVISLNLMNPYLKT
jgi:hypothetical protein